MTRRTFLSQSAALAVMGTMPAFGAEKADEIRGALLHFGTNMWQQGEKIGTLDFEESIWRRLTDRMIELGYNTVFVDIGEAIRLRSHPELAVKGSWEPERFQKEMRRLRAAGLEPIPKFNFSSTHNAWMGVYRRMTGTRKYYEVIKDVIGEAYEIFDRPRYFHLGMDEETIPDQTVHNFKFVVCRQGELLWRDYKFLIKCVERLGARAMAWGGTIRTQEAEFLKNIPRSVLLTVGYYRPWFDLSLPDSVFPRIHKHNFRAFEKLDRAGFDLIPCASNCNTPGTAPGLVKYCRENLDPAHLKGFMTAPWEYCIPYGEPKCRAAIDELGEVFAAKE